MIALSHKRLASSVMIFAASRSLLFLVPLVTIPIFSRIFSFEDFGAWLILNSLFSVIMSQDFGVCSALRVRLAGLQVDGDASGARREFLSISVFILAVVALLSAAILVVRPSVELLGLMPSHRAAAYLAAIFGLVAVLSAPPMHAMYAYIESSWVAGSDTIRALLQLAISGLILFMAPGLLWCVALFYGPWLVYAFLNYAVFLRRRKWSLPSRSERGGWWFGKRQLLERVRGGVPFWILQLINLALGPVDLLLAGNFLGLRDAGDVGLVLRLVNMGYTFLAAVAIGYMGAYGLQYAKGEYKWISRTITTQIGLMLVVGAAATGLLVGLGEFTIRIWTGHVVAQYGIFFMAGLVFTSGGISNLLMGVLQGVGRIERILLPLLLSAGAKIAIAVMLLPHWGANGLFTASTIANMVVAAVAAWEIARLLRVGAQAGSPLPSDGSLGQLASAEDDVRRS